MSERSNHLRSGIARLCRVWRIPPVLCRRRRSTPSRLTPPDERYLRRIHDFRQLLNGEWYWDVFVALYEGPLQYTDLLNRIRERNSENGWPGRAHRHLQESTLSRTLRRLTEGELLVRDQASQFPFPTTYQLSPTARELLTVMAPAVEWAESHADLLVRVQKRRRVGLDE